MPVYLAGQVIREVRMRQKYDGLRRVTMGRRWDLAKAETLGEFSKSDALDLVDTQAQQVTQGSDSQTH